MGIGRLPHALSPGRALPRSFFARSVLDVAPDLLGRVLVAADGRGGIVGVRLTEVEAYRAADDPGSHAYRGETPRNAVMFGPPGHVYVYFTYGMHWCMNLVCQRAGEAAAVLLRAGEVVLGEDLARARRPRSRELDLARGPARLAQALGVDGTLNGADLSAGPIRIHRGTAVDPRRVRTGPRVGVAGAGAPTPWRFWIDGDPHVSAYRPAVRRRR